LGTGSSTVRVSSGFVEYFKDDSIVRSDVVDLGRHGKVAGSAFEAHHLLDGHGKSM
jgi:hypothetical protein